MGAGVAVTTGLRWPVELWRGSVVFSALAAAALALLATPDRPARRPRHRSRCRHPRVDVGADAGRVRPGQDARPGSGRSAGRSRRPALRPQMRRAQPGQLPTAQVAQHPLAAVDDHQLPQRREARRAVRQHQQRHRTYRGRRPPARTGRRTPNQTGTRTPSRAESVDPNPGAPNRSPTPEPAMTEPTASPSPSDPLPGLHGTPHVPSAQDRLDLYLALQLPHRGRARRRRRLPRLHSRQPAGRALMGPPGDTLVVSKLDRRARSNDPLPFLDVVRRAGPRAGVARAPSRTGQTPPPPASPLPPAASETSRWLAG